MMVFCCFLLLQPLSFACKSEAVLSHNVRLEAASNDGQIALITLP